MSPLAPCQSLQLLLEVPVAIETDSIRTGACASSLKNVFLITLFEQKNQRYDTVVVSRNNIKSAKS